LDAGYCPLIRSGEVDWTVVETETCIRNIDPNIASGQLLAVEHFRLPVPRAMLDRLISRVREPFITDFRSFPTCHMPADPWTIERVKAAASLRALSAARSVNGHSQAPVAPPAKRSAAARVKRTLAKTDRSRFTCIERGPSMTLTSLIARAARRLTRIVLPPAEFSEISAGRSVRFAAPANLHLNALLTLTISLQVENHSGPHRPSLVIAAPGLILKRWRAPASGFGHIIVQMPAALFAMRRIGDIELKALELSPAAQFKEVRLHWSILSNPSATFSGLQKLFDQTWYRRKQPTTLATDVEPLWDYLEAGWLDGRNPSAQFDANADLRCYPDVARARINPLLHYIRSGMREGRVAYPVLPEGTTSMACIPIDDQYADEHRVVAASGYFDEAFYRSEYPEILISDFDPMNEFVRNGRWAPRSPGPRFDSEWYLQKNHDVAAAEINPLVHYMRHGQAEGRRPLRLNSRLRDAIGAALPQLTRLEPRLESFVALRNPDLLEEGDPFEQEALPRAFCAFFKSLDKPYDRIIFVPWISLGGADLVAMLVAKAVADTYGHDSVLIIMTDTDQKNAAHWLPIDVQLRAISDFDPKLTDEDCARFVACVVEAIHPKAVMNINSRACWNALTTYGKSMANTTQHYAMLFGRDYDENDRPIGYCDTHFRDCLPQLRRIYCDTEQFPCELAAKYGLTGKARLKLLSVRPPPEATIRAWVRSPNDARQKFSVLWAGRWCREKNLELLLNICRSSPDMEFHVFGAGEDHYARLLSQAQADLDNLIIEGRYPSFDALPLARHDVFLYTSLWDGMPRVLVSAGASGMPVVAPDVGGIRELVDDETGWLVRDSNDVHAFVRALRSVRAAPAEADRRRRQLMERVVKDHNWQDFRHRLAIEPGFLAS
jgi:glycosyltransferase involved in cell wall biosynthesis